MAVSKAVQAAAQAFGGVEVDARPSRFVPSDSITSSEVDELADDLDPDTGSVERLPEDDPGAYPDDDDDPDAGVITAGVITEGDNAAAAAFLATTVDGTEARVYRSQPLIEQKPQTLNEAILALETAREELEYYAKRAKEAAADRKEAQDNLNGCVENVIAARNRERAPSLFDGGDIS